MTTFQTLSEYAAPPPQRRLLGPSMRVAFSLLQVALLVAALAVPFMYGRWRQQALALGSQIDVEASAEHQQFPPLADHPQLLVLSFHDVAEDPRSPYTVTPQQFADSMRLLVDQGFTAATADDVTRAVNSRTVDGRKVLITFDDGAKGIWRYADKILERYQLNAMAFVITDDVGEHQPYYVTWEELRGLQASGRWDFGSHTDKGHHSVPISASGDTGPFLSSLQWLPQEGRRETIVEYRTRISGDLAASSTSLQAHGMPAPRFFAYPFSAAGVPANDPRVPSVLSAVVLSEFDAAFQNASGASALTAADLRAKVLPRLEVTGTTSPSRLYSQIRRASPLPLAEADLLQAGDWGGGLAASNVFADSSQRLRVRAPVGVWRTSAYGPGRAAGWAEYTFGVTARGLVDGAEAAALVDVDGLAGLRIVLSDGAARILRTTATGATAQLAQEQLSLRSNHSVTATVQRAAVTVRVDGELFARVPRPATDLDGAGTVGLAVRPSAIAQPWFSDVTLK
ncbi:MAG: polysaccharide deacetylase family protein [Frankiales bacterium]|nr:polysaccharide deacetylase family protein [Frankiales bacterium]